MFPTVFLFSIFITYSDFGLNSIAISKSFTNLIAFIISFIGIIKSIDLKIFFRWLLPVTIVLILYHFGFTTLLEVLFIENSKSSIQLFKLICFLISTFIISYLLLIFYFKKNRVLFAKLFNSSIKYFS